MKKKHFQYFWDMPNNKPIRFDFRKEVSQRFYPNTHKWKDSILSLDFWKSFKDNIFFPITRKQVRDFIARSIIPIYGK